MHWLKEGFSTWVWTECFSLPAKSTKDHCNRQGASAVPVKHVTRDVHGGGEQRADRCARPYKLPEQGSALTSPREEKTDAPNAQAPTALPQARDKSPGGSPALPQPVPTQTQRPAQSPTLRRRTGLLAQRSVSRPVHVTVGPRDPCCRDLIRSLVPATSRSLVASAFRPLPYSASLVALSCPRLRPRKISGSSAIVCLFYGHQIKFLHSKAFF